MSARPQDGGEGGGYPWLGFALVVGATVAWSAQIVLAALIYDQGANPITILTFRAIAFAASLYLVMRWRGQPLRMAPRERYTSLGLGLLIGAQSFTYYSSIQYIPAGLAVLIFYTSPILVALAMRFVDNEPLTALKLGALVTAFLGLAIAFQVDPEALHPLGIAFAAFSAFGLATTIVVGSRVLRRADSRRMTLHMTAASSTVYAIVILGADLLVLPDSATGWALLGAMPVIYLVAMLAFFTAVPMIGPMRAAMVNNMEPITTILLAALLLGERLGLPQMAGAALVIGAILAMQLATRHAARAKRRLESRGGGA
jgi:drug/metabolite transporter (DMT)-like permease